MSLDFISQIETCKKANDKQLLRNTREQMTSNFPMNSKLWLDWIKDESIDPVYLSNLFKLATVDYLSVDIWKSFILFAIKSSSPEFDLDSIPDQMQLDSTMTIDQALEICKDAVKATSYHIARSHEIWDLYRDFELHLLKINKSSVSKIRKIYTDRLQIPHLEISSTFSEYSTFETNHDPDSYMANLSAMNIIVSKTREIVYDLAVFETRLVF